MRTRLATADDLPAIVPIVNAAFAVEKFFIDGERTSVEIAREQMNNGVFIVAEEATDDGAARIIGSVYVERRGDRGYFGMLAVAPEAQGRGLGRLLVEAAEGHCRANGCDFMDLSVINLRTELPPFYRKLGYRETHTSELPERIRVTQAAHFIHMSKPLE
jgi:ribosomal protein S18 acetylase RimI-like enzyme